MTHLSIFYCFPTAQGGRICATYTIICIFMGNKVFLNIHLTINTSFVKFQMICLFCHRAVDYGNQVVISEKVVFFSDSSFVYMLPSACDLLLMQILCDCCMVVMVFQTAHHRVFPAFVCNVPTILLTVV